MKKTYDEYAEAALHMTADIIDKHGPRVSGTEGCYSACAELEAILGKYCRSIKRESFWLHPASLFAIGKIFTVIYLIGIVAVLIGSRISMGIGLVSMIIGTIYFIMQFLLYADTFDGFFKKVAGNNIIGIIEPQDTVKRQVIIVSHHDSSPVYPFYEKLPLLFPIRLFAAILFFILCLAVLCKRKTILIPDTSNSCAGNCYCILRNTGHRPYQMGSDLYEGHLPRSPICCRHMA
jgi:hypothetical protein